MMLLLAWVTLKPWIRPSPAWSRPRRASSSTGCGCSGPRRLATIGVALEHNQADAEILNRALEPGPARPDRPGPAPRGRYADDPGLRRRDRRPRDGGRRALPRRRGPRPREHGLHGPGRSCSTAPTPPWQLVAQLRREPVDLLVVGSHGHGLVRDLLYGQTVDKVRHGLDIPMLIARPDRTGAPPSRRAARPIPARRRSSGAGLRPPAAVGPESVDQRRRPEGLIDRGRRPRDLE